MADLTKRQIHGHYVAYEPSSHNSLGARFIEKMSSSEARDLFAEAKESNHSIKFKDTDDGWYFKFKYIDHGHESYYLLDFKY